jgi:hypothetical protein
MQNDTFADDMLYDSWICLKYLGRRVKSGWDIDEGRQAMIWFWSWAMAYWVEFVILFMIFYLIRWVFQVL